MKIPFFPLPRALGTATLAVVCLASLPLISEAKDKPSRGNDSKHHDSRHNDHDDRHDDRDRQSYSSRPRSSFTLSLGTGYAGRGYYYGPPNSSYYYQRPEVRYYATREAAPREYYSNESYRSNSGGAAVQRALARRGYYQGSIDGAIGAQSRRAIARYQQDNGLRVTGDINSSLINSLGL